MKKFKEWFRAQPAGLQIVLAVGAALLVLSVVTSLFGA